MNFDAARIAMVESQIRPNGVRDTAILEAMASLPRELFVPEAGRALVYRDGPVLAAEPAAGAPARYLLAPMTLARMLQALDPLASGQGAGCWRRYGLLGGRPCPDMREGLRLGSVRIACK